MNRFLLLTLIVALSAAARATEGNHPLSVEVEIRADESGPRAVFTVKNNSNRQIQVSNAALPWNNRSRIVLVVTDKKGGEPLQSKFRSTDYFGSGNAEIEPGKVIQGSIALEQFAVGLTRIHQEQELIVFWYFSLSDAGGTSLGDYGGWVALPRASTSR